jgi:hypothetical protein
MISVERVIKKVFSSEKNGILRFPGKSPKKERKKIVNLKLRLETKIASLPMNEIE